MIYILKSISLYICVLFVICSHFHLIEAAPKEAPFLEENVLKVGYVENTGFREEDWSGHYVGYGYEYMESLAVYGHWTFEYVPYRSWMELGEALQNGDVDIIPCMPGDYRLFKNTSRTDHVVGRFPMSLIINNLEIKPEMKIGNIPDNYQVPALPLIAEEEGFSYKIVMYPDYYDMIDGFKRGEIDGYIDAMIQPNRMKNLLSIFDRQSYRLLVNSNRKELLDQLNKSMDQMLLDQPGIRDRLNNKYLRNNGFPLILNYHEREFLKNRKTLTAAILKDQKPYSYQTDNGEFKGAIPDIIQKMAKDLNVEINIVGANSLDELAQLLQNGKADFIADAIDDHSWASSNNINLTQPYIKLDFVPVQRKDYAEAEENKNGQNVSLPRVTCCAGFLYTKTYIEPNYPPERRLYVKSIEEQFLAVSNDSADVLYIPRNQAMYYIERTDTYNLTINSEVYFSTSLSMGVSKNNDTPLWHILNKEINHLDKDFINGIVNKNQHLTMRMTPKWFIYHHPTEIIILIILIFWIIGGILFYRHHLKKKHVETIQHMAYTDARYNLPNLAWLESEMPTFLLKSRKQEPTKNTYVAVLALESNSAIVEQYGEELLIKHMQTMSNQLNAKDWVAMSAIGIGSNSLVCICKAESDVQIVDYLNEVLKDYSYIETKDSRIWLHMKAGVCEYKSNDLSVRQVVERANAAAEKSSNNDVYLFDDKLQEDLTLQQQIEGHMEKALADGEFKAWFQPKYDIKTRRIVGAEALVRWTSSELGFMPPGKFIPLFEKNGFVIPVDYAILEQTFQLQKQRIAEGKEVVPISVNQSRLHMTEEGYLDKIKAIIDKYKLSPTGLIELEVTETVFGDFDEKSNQKRAADIISKLHEMGFTISVDDFGSGYSSFMMLNYLPMDVMKIDRSLLNASGDSQRMKNILGNVIKLGRTLNMQVICEGIETREQEELLLELGCHYGQGFLNAKPMPLDDFIKFFEKRNAEVA